MPKVSVIIPCFNQGRFVDEAVGSVLAQDFDDYEIIIVNDGSSDAFTNALLHGYDRVKTRVIQTVNKGVSSARNTGIAASSGKYILPLDADDLIGHGYLRRGAEILDSRGDVGIVSCHIRFFGAQDFQPELRPVSVENMLLHNDLPCASLFRRDDWERVKGYNTAMTCGWEDWDFWLSLLELGVEVVRLEEVLFFYRILPGSRERSMGREERLRMFMKLYGNHPRLYQENMGAVFAEICDYFEILSSRSHRFGRYLENPGLILHSLYKKISSCRVLRKGERV